MALLLRELKLAFSAGGGGAVAILFFVAVVVVVPFAVGPDPKLLSVIGPAILWTGALLAALLGLERLFQADADDGSLDQYMLSQTPLGVIVFIKSLAHWMVTGLPLALFSPLLGLFLNLDEIAIAATFATLMVGTPAISMIGAVGAAITVSLSRGGLLLAILVLPLCIPVIIFGVGAVRGATTDPDPFLQPFLIVVALSLFFTALGPLAAAYALRHGRS